MNFRDIQQTQVEWVRHNFDVDPHQPLRHHPLMGMVEEFGELSSAIFPYLNSEKELRDVQEGVKDALADIVIYACDYSTSMGWNMGEIQNIAREIEPREDLHDEGEYRGACSVLMLRAPDYLGQMNHHCLKEAQGIRGSSEEHRDAGNLAITCFINLLYELGWYLGIDLQEAASEVWSKVRQRDWKKDPNHADQNV